MKITDIQVIKANRFLYVKVYTDEGLTGVGESGVWGYLEASGEVVESFKTYLVGKSPLDIEHHWQYMYRCFHFRGAAVMGAISAIDIALWDIAGKYFHVPIYQLLGGKCRNKARVYYHVGGETVEEQIAQCLKAKAQGYTAVGHLSPFLDEPRSKPYFETYASTIQKASQRVKQIREQVGDDMDLCLEMHRRLKVGEAIAFAKAVESYTPMFLEDPTIPDNFDSMAEISRQSTIPIATGERISTPQEFQMLLQRNATRYLRVSVCVCGGITGARKIASIGESHGAEIVPHNPLSPVSTMACLHIAAAVSNFAILELPNHDGIAATERYNSECSIKEDVFRQSDLVTFVPRCEQGFVPIPTGEGLGIDLQEGIAEKYPFIRRKIITRLHEDGSVVDQ